MRVVSRFLKAAQCAGVSTFIRAVGVFSIVWMSMFIRSGSARAEPGSQPSVASVAMSGPDRAIVDTVESLGVLVTRRELAAGATSIDLLLWARTLPEPLLLWVDSRTSTVSVLRTSDGTSLSRVLGQQTFTESPYVAALAATELLDLMGHTPTARVETAPVVPEPARPALSWLGSLGGELAAGPRRGPALLRPALGIGAALLISERTFLHGEFVAMPYGVAVESSPDARGGRVRYQRSDLAARVGAGLEHGSASLLGYLSAGVGLLRVEAEGIDRERARTRRRSQTFAGGGAVLRHWVRSYVGIAFGLDVAWLTSPARYLLDGRLALEEDSVRIGASLSIVGRIR